MLCLQSLTDPSDSLFLTTALNPYCLVSLAGQKAKSPVVKNSLHPNFQGFGAVFHHDKLSTPITFEIWSDNLLRDTLVGRISVPLDGHDGSIKNETRDLKIDLIDKQGSLAGSVQVLLETFDDLKRI